MSTRLLALSAFALLAGCHSITLQDTAAPRPLDPDFQLSFALSRASFDDENRPVENMTMGHIELAGMPEGEHGGLSWEFMSSWGAEDDTQFGSKFEIDRSQFSGGLRYTWFMDRFKPYLGGGLDTESADIEINLPVGRIRDDSSTFGLYIHAGFAIDIDERGQWFTGLDARYGGIGAEHDFEDANVKPDADYTRVMAFFGLRF